MKKNNINGIGSLGSTNYTVRRNFEANQKLMGGAKQLDSQATLKKHHLALYT